MGGYLYFLVNQWDTLAPDDAQIFIKIGKTKDPMTRICNYVTHHVGISPPAFYKLWLVEDESLEEVLALTHFASRRVTKQGCRHPSEVTLLSKAEVEAYRPSDPRARAIAPHTMLPSEQFVEKADTAQRFEEHWEELRAIQTRTINELADFFRDPARGARKLRSGCGTGKTHMTCEAIRSAAAEDGLLKVCVLCPTKLIADQWKMTLFRLGIRAPILTKIDLQTKEGAQREDQTDNRYRIVTYASSPGLVPDPSWTYVFDEAHSTCGVVDSTTGITKYLANQVARADCRRLFLTFTPKYYPVPPRGREAPGEREYATVNSMDDPFLYGTDVAFPDMGDLVRMRLMPDYRLTLTYRDPQGTLEAVVRETPGAKKVIVYLQNVAEIEGALRFLRSKGEEAYGVYGSMPDELIKEGMQKFVEKPLDRCWLLTCLILLEGVDIPIADTVVLLASWKTNARLVQLLLRAGRWFPKKLVFNVVAASDDDHIIEASLRGSGFEISGTKVRHLRQRIEGQPILTPGDALRSARFTWCVSYMGTHNVNNRDTPCPATADFEDAIRTSQITAVQLGLDKAIVGDCVILKGPSSVVFAHIRAVRTAPEVVEGGKTRVRTILEVCFFPVGDGILVPLQVYKDAINKLYDGHPEKNYIANPRFNGGFRYNFERVGLILHFVEPGVAVPVETAPES
jgi:hypothetical protein